MNKLSLLQVNMGFASRTISNTFVRAYASKKVTTTKKATRKSSTDTTEKVKKVTKKSTKAAAAPVSDIPQESEAFKEYNSKYRCNEFYAHTDMSFYDIENDMERNRCKQPSAL